jgi:hypothetical protein
LNTALVTGAIDHTHAVEIALKRAGFDALAWEGADGGPAHNLPLGSVGCYVQLAPSTVSPSAAAAQSVGAGSLAHRIDTVARVSPLLAPDAAVVLVAAEQGWDPAALQALRALAAAVVAKRVGSGVRVAVVDSVDAGDIAAAARRERSQARAVSLADLAPDMSYVDWRDEVFNLTSGAESTYFGWRRDDGARRAAVLRRSVLSPLPDADDGGRGLARAVLMDALGASGTGDLRAWALGLADDFHDEVISPLPDEGFELPIHEVAAWVLRRSLSDGSGTG